MLHLFHGALKIICKTALGLLSESFLVVETAIRLKTESVFAC